MEKEKEFYERLDSKGVSRRDFMKFCTFLTATMGLSSSFVPKVAEVFAAPKQRPPVIWLHFGECTGCSEALLRSMYPWIDELVLEILSVEYHETIMAAAGHQAEENLQNAVEKYAGKFICVVEGSIATNFNGGYGKVAGKSFLRNRPGSGTQGGGNRLYRVMLEFWRNSCGQTQPRRLQRVSEMRWAWNQNPQPSRLPPQSDQPDRYHCQLSSPWQTPCPG
jgi:hypothetical protein